MAESSETAVATTTNPSAPAIPDEIPPLTYAIVPSDASDERVAALKLIADSVAQQRQAAGRAIIYHPLVLSMAVALLAVATQYINWSIIITTGMGVLMAGLLGVRVLTAPYISLAEQVNFQWLDGSGWSESPSNDPKSNPNQPETNSKNGNGNGNGHKRGGSGGKNDEPIVIIAKFGEEIIGTVVLRVVKKERKGYVRAWTVRLRYRGKGVGEGLLEEAVKTAWNRGARGVEFEEGHANSKRVLYPFFNKAFDRNDKRARNKLTAVVEAWRREKK